MTGIQFLLSKCGVQRYALRDCTDNLAETYANWKEASQLCQLLTGAGFSKQRINRTLTSTMAMEGAFPILLANEEPVSLSMRMILLVADDSRRRAVESILLEALRTEFPIDEVAEKLSQILNASS